MSSYARRRARVPSRQQEAGSRERGVASGTQLGGARGVLFLLGQSTPHISDRKSTRLNSSHDQISYAVFCLKKKKKPEHLAPHRNRKRMNSKPDKNPHTESYLTTKTVTAPDHRHHRTYSHVARHLHYDHRV